MRVYLMRHGEAESFAKDDASRSLTATGRARVASKARHLPNIEIMTVSPYLRALQSADILVSEGLNVQRRVVDDRVLPDCSLEPIVNDLLQNGSEVQLVVAHNPLLSRLVRHLCGFEAGSVALGTADMACLTGEVIAPGCLTLDWIR